MGTHDSRSSSPLCRSSVFLLPSSRYCWAVSFPLVFPQMFSVVLTVLCGRVSAR